MQHEQYPSRQSIRLKGYDYSRAGLYFITVCTYNRECLFGNVRDGVMVLNNVGKITEQFLNEIPEHYPHVELGEFIVMPNHIHCILKLHDNRNTNVGTRHGVSDNDISGNDASVNNVSGNAVSDVVNNTDVRTRHGVSLPNNTDNIVGPCHGMATQQPSAQQPSNINQFGKPVAGSVSVIINQYKSSVKRWCNKNGHEYFKWQSRFHDHIIRNQQSYVTISEYIINNPMKWEDDKFFRK